MALMNGVRQWVFQRVANAFLVLFGLLLLVTVLNGVTYESLIGLLAAGWFKVFALVVLVLGCLNSVLAGWQITGDYAKKFHLPEKPMLAAIVIITAVFFVVGLMILF